MQTLVGNFDGNGWEQYCHRLLPLKYDNYQKVPSKFGGDLGIEGFVISDQFVFQCYCPDGNPTSNDLYTKQRDKITTDIRKLLNNGIELVKIIGHIEIKEWHFLTPNYSSKELLAHCRKKELEVREVSKNHIDSEFRIYIKTEDDFLVERGLLVGSGQAQIDYPPIEIDLEQIEDWALKNNELYKVLDDKLERSGVDGGRKRRLIESNIKCFLIGQNAIETIRSSFPEQYEQIINLKTAYESKLGQTVFMVYDKTPGEILMDTLADFKEELEKGFPKIVSRSLLEVLSQEAVADWMIRCPLDF